MAAVGGVVGVLCFHRWSDLAPGRAAKAFSVAYSGVLAAWFLTAWLLAGTEGDLIIGLVVGLLGFLVIGIMRVPQRASPAAITEAWKIAAVIAWFFTVLGIPFLIGLIPLPVAISLTAVVRAEKRRSDKAATNWLAEVGPTRRRVLNVTIGAFVIVTVYVLVMLIASPGR